MHSLACYICLLCVLPFYAAYSIQASNHSVFNDPVLWQQFMETVVIQRTWKCNFPTHILSQSLESDAGFYPDATAFKRRRQVVLPWFLDDDLWINTLLGACKEIANGQSGEHSRTLAELHMLEALSDFVEHLHYFYLVSRRMRERGLTVTSPGDHDIDKLDPVMIVGYSERFEDGKNTSLWQVCVNRHTLSNVHHQAHKLWSKPCDAESTRCVDTKSEALREMVCDKVSRRVQKDLGGKLEEDMWNVNMKFFEGLPQEWLDKAADMLQSLKLCDSEDMTRSNGWSHSA